MRSVLVRGEYRPRGRAALPAPEDLLASIRWGPVTADELVRRDVAVVFRETGSYLETARRLGLDRRTVKARLGLEGAGEAAERETPAEKA